MTSKTKLTNGLRLLILGLFFSQATYSIANTSDDLVCEGNEARIDHIMWGVPDLKTSIASFSQLTGVEPILGEILGRGSLVNYLVSFGSCQYLEIIGPNPESSIHSGFAKELSKLDTGKVLGLAMAYADLESVAKQVQDMGIETTGPTNGSRTKPDGNLVKWRNLTLNDHGMGTLRFFYVDWLDTAHPAKTTPGGIQLKGVTVGHPNHERLTTLFSNLDLSIHTQMNEVQKVSVELETPNGIIHLTSEGIEQDK